MYNKGGRPALPDSEKRNRIVYIRFTEDEFNELKRMRGVGYKWLGGLIYIKLFHRVSLKGVPRMSIITGNIMSEGIKSLNATGRNIKQMTRKLETMDTGVQGALHYETLKLSDSMAKANDLHYKLTAAINESLAIYDWGRPMSDGRENVEKESK